MNEQEIAPTRLKIARKRRGLTLTALAKSTDISSRSLSAYENGEWKPTSESLQTIAHVLDFPIQFFHGDELDEIPEDSVSFRAATKMTARQRDAALSAGRVALMFDRWIAERFDLPEASIPTLTGYDPESAADSLRARWGLGLRPIRNAVHLVEAHGIRVYSLPADTKSLDAFSLAWRGQPYIFLNTEKSGERGRFDVAHELGHLVMHGEHVVPHGPEIEAQANAFAAAFLMPRASVVAQGLRHATVPQIISAKTIWRVSALALTHRLHELDLTTDWGYRNAFVQLGRLGYRRDEPGGISREASLLHSKVLQSLREDGIGVKSSAATLGISVDDLKSYLFGLTLTTA
ncbi:ImmA/IrrE family metallo-endopeptidase [Kribbella qitaiheensis]|uniref:ImmA/IrrE family metallo-endopeptidase n=1 Tax=Kribbella qitaiheensis TaxID=1544730 RepID=A0A7G6WXI2_9ACTN|nr:XRE family transcriptional regulator [Kribbella qitaiheensis]QNE18697.1 ImmA/IrrE family metallo-endopeptidase [Kribbella qitaiheensis]